jgi:DNA-directed RNA polymerase specialized sigma24 family protein
MARVLVGDEQAWRELAARVHPAVLAVCRRRRLGAALSGADDLHRDVAAAVLERLRADGHAALRRFVDTRAKYPSTSFDRWLGVVVANAFVDQLRARPELQRRRREGGRELARIEVIPLVEVAGGADVAAEVEVRRIVACLAEGDFPAGQRRALLLWLLGHTASEIAADLHLDGAQEAERLLHAARQRLRRRFERP